jgi:hypothetical protein
MHVPTVTGKPSSSAFIGVPANLLQLLYLTRRGRYVTFTYMDIYGHYECTDFEGKWVLNSLYF